MDLSHLDDDAVRATQRLIKFGYEAYLVGGCVRDLLLGRTPKDYDIATEARPQQVKRVFPRNCRIIGRRFKLAHLHFHGNTKILECSTFRRTPQQGENSDDVLITRDNEFGTAEEDALRRDFTVNALFLDPTRDTILDYTNGLQDVRDRVIRTIGNPHVRFREDPVRILRAAKFAGRLGFTVEPETFAAMADTSGDLVRSAPPRLLEEIQRLLRSGHALDSFQLLRDVGAVRSLLPVLADYLANAPHEERVDFWRLLEALDHRVQDGHVPCNGVLLGTLLVQPVLAKAERNPGRSPTSIAEELLGPLCASLRLPRRDAGCLKRICGVQHRFGQDDEEKRFRTEGFLHGPYFLEALELFELRTLAHGGDLALVDRWKDLAADLMGGPERHYDAPLDDEERPAALADEDPGRGDDRDEPAAADDHETLDTPADQAPATADEDAPSNPWAQPAEPGRRRRRRRRRGRRGEGGDRPGFAEGQAAGHRFADAGPEGEAMPADAEAGAGDDDDAPLSVRTPRVAPDYLQPEGADEESDVDVEAAAQADDFPRSDATIPADAPLPEGATFPRDERADEGPEGEPGQRRRRRRRRRRRGGGGQGEPFPRSSEPAPHGEAVDAGFAEHGQPVDAEVVPDPDAPLPAGEDELGALAHAGEDLPAAETGGEQGAGDAELPGEGQPGRRRRRRRRGRRRHRDGNGEHDAEPRGPHDDGAEPALPGPATEAHGGREGRRRDLPQRGQQQQRQPERRPQQQQQQQQQRQQQPQQARSERGGRRERERDRRRGHGAPRDVDVVPRHRDRRGKVEVIEPTALDLSAFDVELDPKRVPTFGSIVEGKGRPKRRGPRVPDDGVDDYKPPPPPGSLGGPAPPPPPPPDDTPDTFGDW